MLEVNKIHQGDCLERLKEVEDNSVDLVEIANKGYDSPTKTYTKEEIGLINKKIRECKISKKGQKEINEVRKKCGLPEVPIIETSLKSRGTEKND